jgi:aryl-alcohol dehydrogenase-like predicted oxidoreductase/NAD-dependent dihydropyrimidine dehydrogenase PreA subunit
MDYRPLGQTGLVVSRLCFGALTIGPRQAGLSPAEGGRIIRAAGAAGVNFFDTAELYDTYPHLRAGLAGVGGEVHLASRSYAPDAGGMRRSLEGALRALGRDHLAVFGLHEVETAAQLRGHEGALAYLERARERGLIRAVALSTHSAEGVRAAALTPGIDVIHPLVNRAGLGVKGGLPAMLEALALAVALGKGLYTMKPLGGGHLRGAARESLAWALTLPGVAAVAVGMRNEAEVRLNAGLVACLAGEPGAPAEAELACWAAEVAAVERRLQVEAWCGGCGACVRACPAGALSLMEGRAAVDPGRCLLCGYCGAVCRDLAIKIV